MIFGRPFVKRFALCYRSVVLSVCNVGVLWPNGWTDQDETWRVGSPRPWPHCVKWGPSSPSPKGAQPHAQFSAHICCGQMAAWIKMSLVIILFRPCVPLPVVFPKAPFLVPCFSSCTLPLSALSSHPFHSITTYMQMTPVFTARAMLALQALY